MIARLRWWNRRRLAVAGTAVTASCGAAISYNALASIARASGQPDALSWIYPGCLDGMIAVGTVAALEDGAHLAYRLCELDGAPTETGLFAGPEWATAYAQERGWLVQHEVPT